MKKKGDQQTKIKNLFNCSLDFYLTHLLLGRYTEEHYTFEVVTNNQQKVVRL